MDVTKLSTGLATVDLQSDVGMAIAKRVIKQQEESGDGLMKMIEQSNIARSQMEQSVNPAVGGNINYFA